MTDHIELAAKTADAMARFNPLSMHIKAAEKRMAEIAALKTHIISFSKPATFTKDIRQPVTQNNISPTMRSTSLSIWRRRKI